jgi:HK97 family phage prohead protease
MTYVERAVDFEPLPEEERASKEGDGKTLEGYAAVFDADTEINSWEGHFNERIARGAFRKTLRERQPVLQFNHGHDSRFGQLPIGRFESVKEDKHGLRVQARLFEHADPIREAIAEGAVTGMSFRMKVVRDSWTDNKGNEIKDRGELLDLLYGGAEAKKRGPLQRTIKEVKLMEAGPVVFPAYSQTSVGVRSAEEMTTADRERLYALAHEGEAVGDEEREDGDDGGIEALADAIRETAREEAVAALIAAGISIEDADAFARGENPFAKKAADSKSEDKECSCDKVKGKHKVSDHKKTSSDPKAKGDEKKSADDDSVAPEAGAEESDEAREEDPDDAAQAGTSTGMSSNARERALRLLDI